MPKALDKETFLNILKGQKKVIFCFDYDGTLVELAKKDIVKEGKITDQHASIINQLAKHKNTKVAIVTGRALSNLKKLIDGKLDPSIMLYGTHGAEILEESNDTQYQKYLKEIRREIEIEEGIEIEEKQISITFHYLNHPEPESIIKKFNSILEKHSEIFRAQTGRDFFEFLPKDINKGLAVEDLEKRFPGYYLLYFGDDLTDNYAFKVINRYNGLSCQITDRIKESDSGYQINMVEDLYTLILSYLEN